MINFYKLGNYQYGVIFVSELILSNIFIIYFRRRIFLMKKILVLLSLSAAFFFGCGDDGDDSKEVVDDTCVSVYCDDSGSLVQPEIGVKTGSGKTVITVDGYQFKDSNGNGSLDVYEDWRLSVSERAEDLVARMTANEKAGFINAPSVSGQTTTGSLKNEDGTWIEDNSGYRAITTLFRRFGMLTLSASSEPERIATYNNSLNEICEGVLREDGSLGLGIPFVTCTNPTHGTNSNSTVLVSAWPYAIGLGAITDPAVIEKYALTVRAELAALGLRSYYGPLADVATEPRWQRQQETFGSSPERIAVYSNMVIRALQGGNSLKPGGIVCAIKHFPGHGAQIKGFDSHYKMGKYTVNPGNNFDMHAYPFEKAFREVNPAACMPCYSIYRDQPFEQVAAGFNAEIMNELGRDQLGFTGYYTSDWGLFGIGGGVDSLPNSGTFAAWGVEGLTLPEKIGKAMEAGMDQLGGHGSIMDIIDALSYGYLSEETLDRACASILKGYFTMGLFENPYVDVDAAGTICNNAESQAAGLDAMHKSIVLVKNSGSTLPAASGISIYYDGTVDGSDAAQATFINETYGATAVSDITLADIAVIRINGPVISRFYPNKPTFLGYVGASSRSLQYLDEEPDAEYGGLYTEDYTDPLGNVHYGVMKSDTIGEFEKILNAKKAITDAGASTKLVVLVNADRPLVMKEFIDYVDAAFLTFGASDRAVLDLVFSKDGLKPTGVLPFELPSSDTEVEAQLEDLQDDTDAPLYKAGHYLTY